MQSLCGSSAENLKRKPNIATDTYFRRQQTLSSLTQEEEGKKDAIPCMTSTKKVQKKKREQGLVLVGLEGRLVKEIEHALVWEKPTSNPRHPHNLDEVIRV